MKILATYNIKGGVGKTAAAINLAWLAAQEGARTLVWDLDPQGATTFYFRIKAKIKGGGKQLVGGQKDLTEAIKGTDYPNLDLLPADFSYRHMDIVLDSAKKPTKRLKKLLAPLENDYDYVFLDCPPSISLVSEAVFKAAEVLLVPIIPTTLSLRTLEQLFDFERKEQMEGIKILPFFSMVDRRKGLHRQIVETLPERHPQILRTQIPYASEVEQMGIHRQPLGAYSSNSRASRAFSDLWAEIKGHLPAP
ncbi:MAG: cobyrinic acid a,c-diamide synthase [Desulfuromonadaceae bacterium GWC2_58_13]|nr:MAG: cobyrinic acid a,c-diamide synthase [Desulfuromonadaceae bacterium GWC2_58_13]